MIRPILHRKNIFVRAAAWDYTLPPVTAKWNFIRGAMGVILLLGTAGCGGISASKSVSPLDFFLPGLIQNQPQPAQPPGTATNSTAVVAQIRS